MSYIPGQVVEMDDGTPMHKKTVIRLRIFDTLETQVLAISDDLQVPADKRLMRFDRHTGEGIGHYEKFFIRATSRRYKEGCVTREERTKK